jgi:hypothetical protein
MRMTDLKSALKIAAILLLVGCEPKLETGYKPRALNSTPDERRAYYAPAFTPESHPPKEKSGAGFDGLK